MKKPSMHDYIIRQPEILKRAFAERELRDFSGLSRIVWTGSGTSYHVAGIAAWWTENILGIESEAVFPVPFAQKKVRLDPATSLVVCISQSGTSASTVEACAHARKAGVPVLCYSQDPDSSLAQMASSFWKMPGEVELVPPETQGFTAALLGILCGMTSDLDLELEKMLEEMPDWIASMEKWVQMHEAELIQAGKVYFCGDDVSHFIALEGALKVGETRRIVTKGMEQEELAHFADLAFDEKDFLFMTGHHGLREERRKQIRGLVEKITDHVFLITDGPAESGKDFSFGKQLDLRVFPLAGVIPFQVLAEFLSRKAGFDTSRFPYEDVEGIAHDQTYHLYQALI